MVPGEECGSAGGRERRRATAAQGACRGGLDCRLGAGHGEERTKNMRCMSVTLEVSKLSGVLKFDASCGAKGGRGGADRLGRGVLEKRARRTQVEVRRFKTHSKHLAHVRDT